LNRIIGFLAVSLSLALACRPPSPKKPLLPQKSAKKQKKEIEHTIIAPPPAYGNKVVHK
jgi:hypothetical protein